MNSHKRQHTTRQTINRETTETMDSMYSVGRVSPKQITETLDSVELMSTSSESTVEDQLRVVEEGPEGWKPGMPMPWSMRPPKYDKPLPLPSRTPSPAPSASPVGRREQGVEPVRILFPQDKENEEYQDVEFFNMSPKEDKTGDAWGDEVFRDIEQRKVKSPLQAGGLETQKRKITPNEIQVDEGRRQELLKSYREDRSERGPSPIGFAKNLRAENFPAVSLMRTVKSEPLSIPSPIMPIRAASPIYSRSRTDVTSRPLTPLSFADALFPLLRGASILAPSQEQAKMATGISATKKETEVKRKVSPDTHLIDLAERGESKAMKRPKKSQKVKSKVSGVSFADDSKREARRMKEQMSLKGLPNIPRRGEKRIGKVKGNIR